VRSVLRPVVSFVVIVAASLAVSTSPVSAGGSSWYFERDHFQPGDSTFVWSPIAWAHNPSLGTPEEGPYHAYVTPYAPDATSPPVIDASATPVGDLVISLEPYDTGFGLYGPHHAELRFTIPNLPPGQYLLVHANDAGKYVGDLSGLPSFWIDAPTVRAAPNFTG
jgi:hypothetical protein